MKATPWITYRTRFLVKAKQLTTSLTFTDVLGRQHSGRKGDYLVESSDGVLRIAPRQIFEDIYVPLLAEPGEPSPASAPLPERQTRRPSEVSRPRPIPVSLPLPAYLARKSPQPDRSRRSPIPGLHSV
jgi:hypothetical protein